MANPYGITEVDVPGILSAVQTMQDRRVQRLLATRQDQREQAEFDNRERVANAWAKFSQRGQGGVGGAAAGYGQPQGPEAPQTPPRAPQQPDYDPWQDDAAQHELIASLTAIDPAQAMEVRSAFRQHSKEEREQAAQNWGTIGNAALGLRQLPPQDRSAELQRLAPMLRSLGIDEQMLAQVDLSDRGLEAIVNQARDIEQVIEGRTPRVMEERAGSTLRTITPGSPFPQFGGAPPATGEQAPLTFEMYRGAANSLGPQGAAAWLQRNNHVIAVATPEEARQLPSGTRILLPDGSEGVVP